jgi:CHRD domain
MRTRLAWLVCLALITGIATTGSVAASENIVTLTARLTGAQEVPGPGDPDGSAKATVMINVDAGEVCFEIKGLKDTGTPNRGHIHQGAAGVAGGIVVPFFELRPTDPVPATDPRFDALESGRFADCVPGDPAILADIVAHPDQYYVNVHNTRFPAGSMRCQLEP